MPYRCNGYFMPGTTLGEKLMDFMQNPEEDRGDHPHWEFPINRWLARNTQLNKKIAGLQLKGVQGYLVISSYTDGDEPQPDETERDRVVRCWLTEWAQVPEDGLMWTSYLDWNGKLTDQGFVPRDLGIRYGKVLPPVTFQQAAEEMEEKFKREGRWEQYIARFGRPVSQKLAERYAERERADQQAREQADQQAQEKDVQQEGGSGGSQ